MAILLCVFVVRKMFSKINEAAESQYCVAKLERTERQVGLPDFPYFLGPSSPSVFVPPLLMRPSQHWKKFIAPFSQSGLWVLNLRWDRRGDLQKPFKRVDLSLLLGQLLLSLGESLTEGLHLLR